MGGGDHLATECTEEDTGKGKGKKGKKGKDKGKDGKGKKRVKKEKLPEGPTVFIAGLNYDIDDDGLWYYFKHCGEVIGARVFVEGKGKGKGKEGQSKGSGIVIFAKEED